MAEVETKKALPELKPRTYKIVWPNVILYIYLHCATFYGIYLAVKEANLKSVLLAYGFGVSGLLGITGGAHRLWAHRSYKAHFPLKLLLVLFQTIAIQDSAFVWARDHRLHHKYSDTDADPHNVRRGFFFSHMGWLLVKKHPELIEKGHVIDISDLKADRLLTLQRKYYLYLIMIFAIGLPVSIPIYFWNESFNVAWHLNIARYVFFLHSTWSVNSFAHLYGYRPYDRNIYPSENWLVSFFAIGEGWHNYHHAFPWDYKTSEFGYFSVNPTSAFIQLMSKLGLAYDLKTASKNLIVKTANKTGDGTHYSSYLSENMKEETSEF